MNCTKAIIPVGGFGTRRLPITKAIEKCMLPIGNRPIVDYVVEDCIKAGITEIIFVVGEQHDQIKAFYGQNEPLEDHLRTKGKIAELEAINQLASKATFHFVVQDRSHPYGTAVPVALAADLIAPNEQVLVLMGDDFIYNADGSSEVKRLLDAAETADVTGAMLAVEVPHDEVSKYGVLSLDDQSNLRQIVEKPAVNDAPSNLINISKYLFDDKLLAHTKDLLQQPLGASGEYYVTDALSGYIASGNRLLVLPAAGEYLDGGTLDGWLYANQRVVKV